MARAKRSTPRRESTRARKATKMRANKPHKGYRRLRALGSGTWDKASRRVMPPLYPKAAYRSSLSAAFFSGFEAVFWCTIILLVVRKTYPTALTVDAQRRVLLPCALRRALGVGPGSRLVALVEGERLVLEPWERVEGVLWEELADLKESLAEELLRERRLEAERDG